VHRWNLSSKWFALLLAAGIASSAGAVFASTPGTLFEDTPGRAASPARASAACTLEPGPIGTFALAITGEAYTAVASRLRPASCTACGATSAVTPTSVSFRVRWTDASSAQVQISVVGATVTGGCTVPDESTVLCGAVSYTLTSTGPGGIVYNLAMPSGCCISGDAFVLIKFVGGLVKGSSSTASNPALSLTSVPCVNCEQYFSTSISYPTLADWCPATSQNSLWISVDADCCTPVPTLRHSWGGVKFLYR